MPRTDGETRQRIGMGTAVMKVFVVSASARTSDLEEG